MAWFRCIVMGLLTSVLLTACASEKAKEAAKKDKEEYVLYYPTGSNIPIKIPKSQAKTSDSDTQHAQDALRDVQQLGQRAVPDPETVAAHSGK